MGRGRDMRRARARMRLPVLAFLVGGLCLVMGLQSTAYGGLQDQRTRFRVEKILSDAYGSDGFRLSKKGNVVSIVGGRRGLVYGEDEWNRRCGIEWFAADCAVTSKVPEQVLSADFDQVSRPALEIRELWSRDPCSSPEFAAHLRLNGTSHELPPELGGVAGRFDKQFRICHTFIHIADARKDFKDHPDWFAEVDGKRIGGGPFNFQLCLSNPEVRERAVEKVLARMRENPEAQIFGISQQDCNDNYCRCENCRAIDEEEGSPAGSIIRFVNYVAERVEHEFGDKMIETLAYRYSKKPPKTAPRKNVIVCLCADNLDYSQTLAEGAHPNNVAFREMLSGWSRLTDRIYLWDYYVNCSWALAPHPNFKVLQPNMRYYVNHGVRYMFAQQGKGLAFHFRELRDYLLAKLMWNPDEDVALLTDNFIKAYYGPAAPFVRDAYDRMNALPHRTKLGVYGHAVSAWLTDAFLDSADGLYEKAEAAVADDPVILRRVRLLHAGIAMCRFVRNREKFVTVWCTREPERFRPAAERFKKDVELFASVRADYGDVDLIHLSPFKEAYERRFRLMQDSVRVPTSCPDAVRFEECCLNLIRELGGSQGRWRRVKDAEASEGEALSVKTDQRDPVARLSFREVAFDEGVRYRLSVRLRAECEKNAEGEVVRIGVQGADGEWRFSPCVLTAGDVSDRYAWYDVLEWEPNPDDVLVVLPGAFERSPAAKSLLIDQLEFVRKQKGVSQ